jgi:hypothetical protein
MKTWIRDNSLSLALSVLFLASLVGQMVTGFAYENQQRLEHAQTAIAFGEFLKGGTFLSTLFENWESEFLQMWAYVMLTAYLFQRGSPESRDPDNPSAQDRDPALEAKRTDAPAAVRAGGLARRLYAHSLGTTLLILFLLSFVLHWVNSYRQASEEASEHGQAPLQLLPYLADPQFWFESFQNWQSEFLATGLLVVLAIFLRERRSPESKPVGAPHRQTGAG